VHRSCKFQDKGCIYYHPLVGVLHPLAASSDNIHAVSGRSVITTVCIVDDSLNILLTSPQSATRLTPFTSTSYRPSSQRPHIRPKGRVNFTHRSLFIENTFHTVCFRPSIICCLVSLISLMSLRGFHLFTIAPHLLRRLPLHLPLPPPPTKHTNMTRTTLMPILTTLSTL
jgi:hypothetical protein